MTFGHYSSQKIVAADFNQWKVASWIEGACLFCLGGGAGEERGSKQRVPKFLHMHLFANWHSPLPYECVRCEYHFANRCMCNGCAWAMGECDFAKRGMCNGWMLLCKNAQMVTAILQRGTMCSGWTLLCKKAHMQTVNATLRHLLYRKVLGE